jgi:hypothetical protein
MNYETLIRLSGLVKYASRFVGETDKLTDNQSPDSERLKYLSEMEYPADKERKPVSSWGGLTWGQSRQSKGSTGEESHHSDHCT